jgi:hypothetical protein
MEVWIVDEADDFLVINCCRYALFQESGEPPWDIEPDEWSEIELL